MTGTDATAPQVIDVRVRAGARRQEVTRGADGILRVSVHQAPERGKANAVVIEVLAEALGVRRSQVEIVSGQTSPQKRVAISGLSATELQKRLAGLADRE